MRRPQPLVRASADVGSAERWAEPVAGTPAGVGLPERRPGPLVEGPSGVGLAEWRAECRLDDKHCVQVPAVRKHREY
jgi:hypothetical protein